MSKFRKEPIECTDCGTKGIFKRWESVDVDEDPSLREKVMSGEIFDWECPKCGLVTSGADGILYHDNMHQFMILYQFCEPFYNNSRDGIEMPDLFGLENYCLRRSYGLNGLRDKILALETGLNDVALERVKYDLIHFHDMGLERSTLYFHGINHEAPDHSEAGSMGFLVYNDWKKDRTVSVPMDAYYEQKLAMEGDPRMHVTDWACVDQKWLGRRLNMSGL